MSEKDHFELLGHRPPEGYYAEMRIWNAVITSRVGKSPATAELCEKDPVLAYAVMAAKKCRKLALRTKRFPYTAKIAASDS